MATENELVIQARPQIAVSLTEHDEVEISTARIGDDFKNVEHDVVLIPLTDVREVAEAMLALLKSCEGED
jgi:hypothetical protein